MKTGVVLSLLVSAVVCVAFGKHLGRSGVVSLCVYSIAVLAFMSLVNLGEVVWSGNECEVGWAGWVVCGQWSSVWGINELSVGAWMSSLICVISFLVVFYLMEYMSHDAGIERYLVYIMGFLSCMLVLVQSSGLLVMFVGYEGVGILSYALISYWRHGIDSSKASIQAVLVNRVGDVCVILGMVEVFKQTGSVRYSLLEASLINGVSLWVGVSLVFIGCMSKSAQLGLHLWLPNAMAAPTPISALLHAATMVTAGVYVLVKLQVLLDVEGLGPVLVFMGSLTILVAGSIGLFQHDVKRVVAYSTGSQLGYMLLGCGLSQYEAAITHLLNHGTFKALLFLSVGVVIHGLRDEQDVRSVGGMLRLLGLSYVALLLGSVCLLGLPYLSGFYLKELLLEVAYVRSQRDGGLNLYGYVAGVLGASLTGAYSGRLWYLVYISGARGLRNHASTAHEGQFCMSFPLVVLMVLSVVSGYALSDVCLGLGTDSWNGCMSGTEDLLVEAELLTTGLKLVPVFATCLGLGVSLFFCSAGESAKREFQSLYRFLSKRWYFDKTYNEWVVQCVLVVGYDQTYKAIDKWLLESIGGVGLRSVSELTGAVEGSSTSGLMYRYLLPVMVSTSVLCVLLV